MKEIKFYEYAETDIVDRYIRVKKKDIEDFKDGSLTQTDLDAMNGVSAIIGVMKGDEGNAIQSYLFVKDMWNKEDASEWVYKTEEAGEIVEDEEDGKKIITKIIDILNALKEEEFTVKNNADLMTIDGVEIFQTGKHNGDNYTLSDLENMVENFEPLKQKLQPYVKLGHNEEQNLLAKDGLPAAGWIDKIYIQGDKLLANIVDVPRTIYDLIKNKAYKRISSEVYWNLQDKGDKIYKRALKAIALLGGDTPAVGSLSDVQALYTKRSVYQYESDGDIHVAELEIYTKKEVNEMTDAITDLQKEFSEYKAEMEAKYSEIEAEKVKMEKNYADLQMEARSKEIDSLVDGLIENKKIKPAQKEGVVALYKLQDSLKSYDDSAKEDIVTKVFEDNQDVVNTEEVSEEGEKVEEEAVKKAAKIKEAKTYEEARRAYLEGDK